MPEVFVPQLPLTTPELDLSGAGPSTVRRSVRPSGLRVLSESVPGARSSSVGFWVPVGSRDEDPIRYGSTHFLEHLLFKGTRMRSALEIATAFDAVGGDNNAMTAKEYTCYYAKVRDQDLDMAVDVLADMIADSVLDPVEFESERQVILEELAMASDDPGDVAHERFAELVYPGHALGRPIGGTPETIAAVSRDHVIEHYRANYAPQTLVVSAAGAVDHNRLVERVEGALERAGWALGTATPRPRRASTPVRLSYSSETNITDRAIEQENLVLGVPGISGSDSRRFALSVLSAAFGGGMSSRLFQEVREKRGLAYSVYSFSGMYSDAGSFGMYAGCGPDKSAEVVRVMWGELQRLAADGLSDDELERAKGQIAGGMALGLEDSQNLMSRLGRSEIGTGEFFDLDASLAKISEVTTEDVRAIAIHLAGQPASLAAVGPVARDRLGAFNDGAPEAPISTGTAETGPDAAQPAI